jgi:2-dehydropantoate 2-reductase
MQVKQIKTVAIIGAGAMGGAYASMFSSAPGFTVFFIACGERYKRLREQTLRVNGKVYEVPVKSSDEIEEPADMVLVALKHHHLAEAMEEIKAAVGEETVILSVMNGLESEQIISAACGMEKVLYAVAVGIDAVHEKGCYTYASPGRIIFGKGPQAGDDARVARLQEALERAAIPCETPDDILRAMWWKFMINVGINQSSAVLRAPYGVFQSSADARELMRMLMEEVIALAGKLSINLTKNDFKEWLSVLAALSPSGKTSMLQDVEAGRKTEVEIFAGKVVSLGREHRIPTPANEIILHILKVIEKRS